MELGTALSQHRTTHFHPYKMDLGHDSTFSLGQHCDVQQNNDCFEVIFRKILSSLRAHSVVISIWERMEVKENHTGLQIHKALPQVLVSFQVGIDGQEEGTVN